jgi:hypothetical protein
MRKGDLMVLLLATRIMPFDHRFREYPARLVIEGMKK